MFLGINFSLRRKKIKSEEEWEDDPLLSRVPTSDAEWLKYIELDRFLFFVPYKKDSEKSLTKNFSHTQEAR